MKHLFSISILAILFCFNTVNAQVAEHGVIDRSSGNLLYLFQAVNVEGTPFLKDEWTSAVPIGKDGYRFPAQKVKFDIYNNKFIFNLHDTAFELPTSIAVVYVFPNANDTSKRMVFKKGFAINNTINAGKYLQVIAEGKLSLLKYHSKDEEEYNEYGNANKLKRFKELEQYYVLHDGKFELLGLSAKNLESQTGSQWPQVSAYMKQNNISAKDEKGWAAAIAYYNSL